MFALAILLAGCTTPAAAPKTTIDPNTGVSLIVADESLVLARDRRDIAAQARDYLTLVAAEIDEAGNRHLILAAHQWSTIDSRTADVRPLAGAELLLVADGRDFRLKPLVGPFVDQYAKSPALRRPDDAEVVTTLYDATPDMLGFIAASHTLSASFPSSLPLPYALWKDGRPALTRLLAEIGVGN
jgi:hypothetical protein